MSMYIKNSTSVPVDIFYHGEHTTLKTEGKQLIEQDSSQTEYHGHSNIGGFVIFKNDSQYSVRVYGKLTTVFNQKTEDFMFEILEKK